MTKKRTPSHDKAQTPTPAQIWRESLQAAYEAALAKLPAQESVINEARRLIVTGVVTQEPGSRALLHRPDGRQQVVRPIGCPEHGEGPTMCPCRMAAALLHRTWQAVEAAGGMPDEPERDAPVSQDGAGPADPPAREAPEAPAPTPPDRSPGQAPCPVPPEFLVPMHGTTFVRYAGLRMLAEQRGVVLQVKVLTATDSLAVCEATARMANGQVWVEIGDATPTNVTKAIAPHFIRMAATRAKARVLREALGIHFTALEELGEGAE